MLFSIYASGVLVAAVVGLAQALVFARELASVRARNLRQVGLHYAWGVDRYETIVPGRSTRIGWTLVLVVVTPMLSWFSTVNIVWGWLRSHRLRARRSQDIRALHDRLARIEMSKDDVIEWQEEMARHTGSVGPILTGSPKDLDPLTMVLSDDEWPKSLKVTPSSSTFEFCGRAPDRITASYATFEYRFEGEQLYMRLLEERSEHYGRPTWDVRDGNVHAAEIRQRARDAVPWGGKMPEKIPFSDAVKLQQQLDIAVASRKWEDDAEARIARYEYEVGWHPVGEPRMRYFLMTMHPSVFSRRRIRELARLELRALDTFGVEVAKRMQEMGFRVEETASGIDLFSKGNWSEQELTAAETALSECGKVLGMTPGQLSTFKTRRAGIIEYAEEHHQ